LVGGVVLVPALVYLAGMPIQAAVAAAMCAYLVSGIVGTYAFAKAGSIRWNMTAWMWVGAVPAGFAGALFVNVVPAAFIELAIGMLAAVAGFHALVGRRDVEPSHDSTRPRRR
jgi:uncharacterized membrane protein YfcA